MRRKRVFTLKKTTNSVLSAFTTPFIKSHFKLHSELVGSLKRERLSLNLMLYRLRGKKKLNSVFQSTKGSLSQYRANK